MAFKMSSDFVDFSHLFCYNRWKQTKNHTVINMSTVEMWITSAFYTACGKSYRGLTMSQYDLMKLFSQYDGEISESDFTPEELEEYLKYAEREEAPLSPREWKAQYFEFYDDVKDKSLKKQDW